MTLEDAIKDSKSQRDQGKSVGYTTGVFDLFHIGHINYLKMCRQKCDYLIVGVDCDILVAKNKGKDRPFDNESIRIDNVMRSGFASTIFIKTGSTDDILRSFNPSFYFIPDNRQIGSTRLSMLADINVKTIIIPHTNGISTTLLSRK